MLTGNPFALSRSVPSYGNFSGTMPQLSGNAVHEHLEICAARLNAPSAQGLPDRAIGFCNVYFLVPKRIITIARLKDRAIDANI